MHHFPPRRSEHFPEELIYLIIKLSPKTNSEIQLPCCSPSLQQPHCLHSCFHVLIRVDLSSAFSTQLNHASPRKHPLNISAPFALVCICRETHRGAAFDESHCRGHSSGGEPRSDSAPELGPSLVSLYQPRPPVVVGARATRAFAIFFVVYEFWHSFCFGFDFANFNRYRYRRMVDAVQGRLLNGGMFE